MPEWGDRRNDYWNDYRNTLPPNEYQPNDYSWKNNNPISYHINAPIHYNVDAPIYYNSDSDFQSELAKEQSTSSIDQRLDSLIQSSEATWNSLEASIKNIEIHLDQIASCMQESDEEELPSPPEKSMAIEAEALMKTETRKVQMEEKVQAQQEEPPSQLERSTTLNVEQCEDDLQAAVTYEYVTQLPWEKFEGSIEKKSPYPENKSNQVKETRQIEDLESFDLIELFVEDVPATMTTNLGASIGIIPQSIHLQPGLGAEFHLVELGDWRFVVPKYQYVVALWHGQR